MDATIDNESDDDDDNVFVSPKKIRDVKKVKRRKVSKPISKVRKCVKEFEYGVDNVEQSQNNLTLIQGYIGHLKDPEYVTIMHHRLYKKLKFFTDRLSRIVEHFEQIYEHPEPPSFICETKKFVIDPLRKKVYANIASYDDFVLQAFTKETLGAALDIGNDKELLNIVNNVCRTKTYSGTFTYYYETNTIEYDLFFDGNRQFFDFDKSITDES